MKRIWGFARTIGVLTVLGLTLSLGAPNAAAGDVTEIEATGQADIRRGDKAGARDRAIEDALRRAVEQAVGTMVESETVTENFQLVSDRIYAKAAGFVTSYEVASEKAEDGVYTITVRAKVAQGELQNELDAITTLLRRKGMPRLMVMISEQNVGQESPSYWWGQGEGGGGGGSASIDLRTSEAVLMEMYREKGFTFVDHQALSGRISAGGAMGANLDNQQVRTIANLSDAEVVIYGRVLATDAGQTMRGVNLRTAWANMSLRAVNTDNGEVIASVEGREAEAFIDPLTAGTRAIKKVTKKVGQQLMEQILEKWQADTTGTNMILVKVDEVPSFRALRELVMALEDLRGVKAVQNRGMQAKQATLNVELAATTDAFAMDLDGFTFGDYKCVVTAVTGNQVGISIEPK